MFFRPERIFNLNVRNQITQVALDGYCQPLGSALGFTAPLPYFLVAILALFYGITVTGDSASLTAGVVAVAPVGFRGTTLAVYSTIGFGAAFLGPLTVGVVLDFFGGNQFAWAMGFLTMAAGCIMGPLFLSRLNSK